MNQIIGPQNTAARFVPLPREAQRKRAKIDGTLCDTCEKVHQLVRMCPHCRRSVCDDEYMHPYRKVCGNCVELYMCANCYKLGNVSECHDCKHLMCSTCQKKEEYGDLTWCAVCALQYTCARCDIVEEYTVICTACERKFCESCYDYKLDACDECCAIYCKDTNDEDTSDEDTSDEVTKR
jgi:hypothetical protein